MRLQCFLVSPGGPSYSKEAISASCYDIIANAIVILLK
jgi:hypothetical protein